MPLIHLCGIFYRIQNYDNCVMEEISNTWLSMGLLLLNWTKSQDQKYSLN